ncbi:MAG: hypothetical protein JWO67_5277, partial [Streptosporangiaceae bacterium]|nr:hypothetical protein [Streptosporangiaceae bacterium]
MAQLESEVQHPVTLDDDVRVFQQMPAVDSP